MWERKLKATRNRNHPYPVGSLQPPKKKNPLPSRLSSPSSAFHWIFVFPSSSSALAIPSALLSCFFFYLKISRQSSPSLLSTSLRQYDSTVLDDFPCIIIIVIAGSHHCHLRPFFCHQDQRRDLFFRFFSLGLCHHSTNYPNLVFSSSLINHSSIFFS